MSELIKIKQGTQIKEIELRATIQIQGWAGQKQSKSKSWPARTNPNPIPALFFGKDQIQSNENTIQIQGWRSEYNPNPRLRNQIQRSGLVLTHRHLDSIATLAMIKVDSGAVVCASSTLLSEAIANVGRSRWVTMCAGSPSGAAIWIAP